MANKGNDNSDENVDSSKNNCVQRWISVERIIELSEKFPMPYPEQIETMKCVTLVKKFGKEIMETNINSSYPVIHESVLKLYEKFLRMNRDVQFYRNMTVVEFVDRLLRKRAVSFIVGSGFFLFFTDFLKTDKKCLDFSPNVLKTETSKDGSKQIHYVRGGYETVGTSEEKEPLTRENCLTYDEVELSSFLSVSSFTVFINSGTRCNNAIYDENRENIQDRGIIIGIIGPQFSKPGVTDYKRMVLNKTKKRKTKLLKICCVKKNPEDKMDKLMKNLYASPNPNIVEIEDQSPFNMSAYKIRLAMSFDTLLIEANSRAKELNEQAFVHVVGIGLGVWLYCVEQNEIFIETFYERLEALESCLNNVSDVRFAYIKVEECKKRKEVGEISIHFENIPPHTRIEKGKLLVVSYAWDGNALPGNEFWGGYINDSSDSAAASSTQISELLNPHINEKVCGQNLRIATSDKGVITYEDYLKSVKM